MAINIRRAERADVQAIAWLHYRIWRETYRSLAPEEAYNVLTEAVRLSRWQDILVHEKHNLTILLAETNGQLAGFGVAGAPSYAIFKDRSEVKFLYIDGAFKRMGIGRKLLTTLARSIMNSASTGLGLGVVLGNDPALHSMKS